MGMNNSFLAGYLAEKEVRKCSKISLKERSTVYLLNFVPPMDCVAYQVDGNIIKGADKDKCDKLVVATTCTDEKVCVFVELKGSDVAHAVKHLMQHCPIPCLLRTERNGRKLGLLQIKFLQTQEGLWLKERKLISVESIIVN